MMEKMSSGGEGAWERKSRDGRRGRGTFGEESIFDEIWWEIC